MAFPVESLVVLGRLFLSRFGFFFKLIFFLLFFPIRIPGLYRRTAEADVEDGGYEVDAGPCVKDKVPTSQSLLQRERGGKREIEKRTKTKSAF